MSTPKPDALRVAAQAVVDRWRTPLWKDAPATAEYINALERALAAQPAPSVVVPEGFALVPTEILDRFPEINPSNYDHDDACALNAWGVELVLASPPPAQPTQAEPALRAIFAHWNEFGPEHGFGELMDRLSAVQHTETSEAQTEAFIQAAISNAPEPLRKLGEFLSRVLDEDKWPAAERLLLAIAARPPREPVQPLSDKQIDAAWSAMGSFTDRQSDYRIFARAIERLITERMSAGGTK